MIIGPLITSDRVAELHLAVCGGHVPAQPRPCCLNGPIGTAILQRRWRARIGSVDSASLYRNGRVFLMEDDLSKRANRVTEEVLRNKVRVAARTYPSRAVELPGDIIGKACEITGIDDPAGALTDIVEDAVARWARLQVLDHIAQSQLSLDEPDVPTKEAPSSARRHRRGASRRGPSGGNL